MGLKVTNGVSSWASQINDLKDLEEMLCHVGSNRIDNGDLL